MSLTASATQTKPNRDTTDAWAEFERLRDGWKQDLSELTREREMILARMEEIDRTRALLEGMIAQIKDMDDRPKVAPDDVAMRYGQGEAKPFA